MIAPDQQQVAQRVGGRESFPRHVVSLWLLAVVGSVPLSVAMGAIAEIIVALVAVPVALVLTRDWYVTPLALSYGPFAAAASLLWLISATLLWSIVAPALAWLWWPWRWAAALLAGIVVTAAGVGLAQVVANLLPLIRSHPMAMLDVSGVRLFFACLAGGIAGVGSLVRAQPLMVPTQNGKATAQRFIAPVAIFALILALCLEGGIAIFAALNWL